MVIEIIDSNIRLIINEIRSEKNVVYFPDFITYHESEFYDSDPKYGDWISLMIYSGFDKEFLESEANSYKSTIYFDSTPTKSTRLAPYTEEEYMYISRSVYHLILNFTHNWIHSISSNPIIKRRGFNDFLNCYHLLEVLSTTIGIRKEFYRCHDLYDLRHTLSPSNQTYETYLEKFRNRECDHPSIYIPSGDSLVSLLSPGSLIRCRDCNCSEIYTVEKLLFKDAEVILHCKGDKYIKIANLLSDEWLFPCLHVQTPNSEGWRYLYPDEIPITIPYQDLVEDIDCSSTVINFGLNRIKESLAVSGYLPMLERVPIFYKDFYEDLKNEISTTGKEGKIYKKVMRSKTVKKEDFEKYIAFLASGSRFSRFEEAIGHLKINGKEYLYSAFYYISELRKSYNKKPTIMG